MTTEAYAYFWDGPLAGKLRTMPDLPHDYAVPMPVEYDGPIFSEARPPTAALAIRVGYYRRDPWRRTLGDGLPFHYYFWDGVR
jgi:hypothetical protein